MAHERILVTGASGSGTTTLARAVANAWAVPHADVDDYYWLPTDPPYLDPRPPAERVQLMQELFLPRRSWVLSGSILGWGAPVIERCSAVVFLTLEPDERMRRLSAREQARRTRQPLDPAKFDEFIEWARSYDDPEFTGRSRVVHEAWLAALPCPVLRLDSTLSVDQLRDAVLAWAGEGATS